MIAKLRGLVDAVGEDFAVIDVGGVGYLVFCSGRTLSRLPAIGQGVSLVIETHVREDHIHLYGFGDGGERDWFRLLTTVQGVGAKVALAVLSTLSPDALTQAVAAQDKAALTRASGVGPKLAQRIVGELKDKVANLSLGVGARLPGAAMPEGGGGLAADAVSALVNLGYGRGDAFAAVAKALGNLGEGASLDALIKAGLKALGPGDRR
jgi:Holliday junction DNA helicase RuvA